MQALCPQAWLINTANPVFEGATLLLRESRIRSVGICHGHLGYLHLAARLGLEPERLQVQVAGFSHCVWLTDLGGRIRYNARVEPSFDPTMGPEGKTMMKNLSFTLPGLASFYMHGQWVAVGGGLPPAGMNGRALFTATE